MKSEIIYFPQFNQNIEFLIGKNEKENFEIIDNSAPEDLWFHLDQCPSCHVIARLSETIDRKNIRYVIKKGAWLCKQNSKYRSERHVPIIYTRVKNLQKTSPTGSVICLEKKDLTV